MRLRVAVIGAGAAGLCTARHILARPETFRPPCVYELAQDVGGTWVYSERTGIGDHGLPVFSSMYQNMRTNLPKEVMAFPGFPFNPQLPSFVLHTDVLAYLDAYADHYNIRPQIKFETFVELVKPAMKEKTGSGVTWEVTTLDLRKQDRTTEKFDAVIVCNGHYFQPSVPHITGVDIFQGRVLHSHNYRRPEPFAGQSVVLLGASNSGQDISLELAETARLVTLSHHGLPIASPLPSNVHEARVLKRMTEKTVIFEDESSVPADAVIFCTGYEYRFPFLSTDVELRVHNGRVSPLYKHLVHMTFPSLIFIGICQKICPFPHFDVQVRFALAVFANHVRLPSRKEMEAETIEEIEEKRASGVPDRHFHVMEERQWSYHTSLLSLAGETPLPPVLEPLFQATKVFRKNDLLGYKNRSFRITGLDTWENN
uniref:uncharacterized protein n=1 Tax=Myxine glutinosa TaxID=7769 RepID=UPI00358E3199